MSRSATRAAARLAFAALLASALIACGDAAEVASTPTASASVPPATLSSGGRISVLTGADPTEKKAASIKVAAASDLRNALTLVQSEIERSCETKITFVFGSSGQLTTQIAAGADFGLLLSADAQYPADLAKRGLVVPNGLASYGVGRIVLATRSGIEPVTDIKAIARSDIKKIAMGNPEHAPYGRAGEQALKSAGVYDQIKDRLVLGENIRQTTDYVEQGNADVGITALALVIKGSPAKWTLLDASLHRPIEQGGAVVKGTGAELTGRCVLQYILDPAGQAVLKDYGFEAVTRP